MGDPVTLKEKLKDQEHNNWLKAVLILRELKVGISSFVEVRCREAQEDVLQTILNKLPPHVTAVPQCTTCTRASLQRNIACPQNVCPFILQEINTIHWNRHIQLSCTDVSAWTDTSRCWEFAKTFIMGKGYGDTRSVADTDCAGLLSIIINCVWIHKYLTENMGRNPTVFHEVKNLRNDVMHSPDNRLSNALLQDLIKACVQILADSKILAADQTAIAARERIKEIEGMLLTVSNVDYPSVFLEVEENLKQEISDLAEKQTSQEKGMSDLAEKQTSQEKGMSNLAGKQTSQAKDISDIAGKQTSQEKNISDITGKQTSQAKNISDISGKQTSQAKDISDIAGKQTSQAKDISDIARRQTSQEKNISDLARQQALQGNQLQVKRKSEEGGQWKAEKKRMVAETEAGAAKLKEDMRKGYQEDLSTVFETQLTDGVSAIHMFSPIIIREDLENRFSDNSPARQGTSAAAPSPISHKSGKVEQIQSYRDIFFKDEQLKTRIVLLGEAGVGKTTFCNHIVNIWCLVQTDDCQRDLTENDQALINVLKQFEYLFVVRCRDTKEHISVVSMIKGMFCSEEDDMHIDNIFRCKTEQCLVIIDGLDEWLYTSSVGRGKNSLHVLPDCTNIRGATIIMTSRPWKVEALPQNSLLNCRVLQLEGLDRKGIHNLTQKFIKALEPSVTDHETLSENFSSQVYQEEMGDIVKQPLLLRSIIESWLSRNHKLHRSLTMNYAGMINSVVSHSDDKLSDKDKSLAEHQEKESLPGCFTEMKTCLTHSGLIRKISALAFKTLVLKEKERSLVFSKKDLIDEVGEECLDLCLKLGILSETKAFSFARVKHVTLSFIHKSVQECFAAVHLSEDEAGLCLTEFTSKLNSLNEVFDHALILIFLFGMSPSKGQTVLNHVYGVVDACSEIKAYRQCADCNRSDVAPDTLRVCRRLFNELYVRCAVELKHTAPSLTGQDTSSATTLCIPDVLLDGFSSKQDDVVHLLFCPGEHIKSLRDTRHNKTSFHIVESLECMTNVEKLMVNVSSDHLDEQIDLIIKSLPHLQQLQSLSLTFEGVRIENGVYEAPELHTTRLFTELGKLTNLVSLALSFTDLTSVEFPKNLKSVHLSISLASSDLVVNTSCTEVYLSHVKCYCDLVLPSTCTTLICDKVYCKGNLVFPSTCTTLSCSNVSCRGKLVFPSTCNTLKLTQVKHRGDYVFPSTCTNMYCSNVSFTGDLVLPSTCNTLECMFVSCTGDLVFPSNCTELLCCDVSYSGTLVFPLVCSKLHLNNMALPDISVLPDSMTSLDIEDVNLTQQLCKGIRSTSTLQRLGVLGLDQELYLNEHLDLSACLSLQTLILANIELDSCGVLVPQNVREITMDSVTLSEEYWYQLVQNVYTCHNVRVNFSDVTINEATLKYIRQHFIVTHEHVLPEESVFTDEEETNITDEEETDITDEMNDKIDEKDDRTDNKENTHEDMLPDESNLTDEEDTDITDENNDRTDEKNDITDEKNDKKDGKKDITDEKKDTIEEKNYRTDEKNDRTDETNDRTDEKNDRIDEKENDKKDEENGFTTAKRDIQFHTKCPENK